jgi:competence protein ComFA
MILTGSVFLKWRSTPHNENRGTDFPMRAELYGIRNTRDIWQWRVTLDFETDVATLPALFGACTEAIRFRPEVSLGQAVHVGDRLQRECGRKSLHPSDIWREFVNGCWEAGMSREHLARIQMVRWLLHTQASTSSRAPLNDRVLDQLIRILAGRSLLPEELEGLMEYSGLAEWQPDWKRYVQAGVCLDALELVPGMVWNIRRSWTGAVRHTVQCRRCGTEGTRDVGAELALLRRIPQVVQRLLGIASSKREPVSARKRVATVSQDTPGHRQGVNWSVCKECGGLCAYCEECLTMGRIRQCSGLIRGKPVVEKDRGQALDAVLNGKGGSSKEPDWERWGLSPAQREAAGAGVHFLRTTMDEGTPELGQSGLYDKPHLLPRFLIWAVTGAGKTEMIFPMIEHELAHHRQVLIATPRKDVVLELAPRLRKAFPECSMVSLYGGSEERWSRGQVTLATTHQLMRFYRAFDLVIIDELDAYPYHNNPMLIHAAEEVCKRSGRYVLLSATPPAAMQKDAARGTLPNVRVPVRYHRHPLPVPRRLVLPQVDQMLKRGHIPGKLKEALASSLRRGAQVFVFIPRIAWVEPLVRLLGKTFPDYAVKGTSSKDEHRREAVQGFRDRAFSLLVTTTILERGVTVPKSDVFILGADAALFDEASLVQMAGRAGRSKDDPAGRVFFGSKEWTASQLRAIDQIRHMNRLAAGKGYLLEGSSGGGSDL